MKSTLVKAVAAMALLLSVSLVAAQSTGDGPVKIEGDGYVSTVENLVVKNGDDGCVRTAAFDKSNQIAACEGALKKLVSESVAGSVPARKLTLEPGPALKQTPLPSINSVLMTSSLTSGFAPGSAQLTPDGEADLNALIKQISSMRQVLSIKVAGHSDGQGAATANMALSKQRAATVGNMLVQAFPTMQITAAGFGERVPIASNDTVEGRAQNRRVVVSVEGWNPN